MAAAKKATSARAAVKKSAAKKAPAKASPKKTAPAKAAPKSAAKRKAAAPKKSGTKSRTSSPAKTGRPRKVSDEEILAALLEEPSPSKVAATLGVHRNTVVARLRDPAVRELLIEHRRRAVEAASLVLAERAGEAVLTLVALMGNSTPADSVRLGAASLVLKAVKDFSKADPVEEKPDEVWQSPPKFQLRLVQGGAAAEETDE